VRQPASVASQSLVRLDKTSVSRDTQLMVVTAQPSRVTTKGDETTRVGRIPEFGTPRQKIRTLGYSIDDDT
jgi:hypothetical protein